MRGNLPEFFRLALEALGRYRLRTALSVLGVVFGVAAVIAMMSVSEGAARDALQQVEALGVDNLVARSTGGVNAAGTLRRGLVAEDAERAMALVPLVRTSSPLVLRYMTVRHAGRSATAPVVGVRANFESILRLTTWRGRFLSASDERTVARSCVLGSTLAEQLFGSRDPVGEWIHVAADEYQVVGVLRERGENPNGTSSSIAWHNLNQVAIVPLPTLTGRTIDVAPTQPVDEVWLQTSDGARTSELGAIFQRALERKHPAEDFTVVVPRELLAQRYRTQRTFSIVVGSVAALALLVGGIGIMNIMLTSVVERTREIGVRRTAGATRSDVRTQFLVETLLMTVCGGAIGILIGIGASWGIATFAGWTTHVSTTAVSLGFGVSFLVGLAFGLYPAMKAASLEPVDAMRYE
jgi:putative ABC transport system permease protein